MRVVITIHLTAESRDELIRTFGGQFRALKEHMEELARQGNFPPNTELRWLLTSGRWD